MTKKNVDPATGEFDMDSFGNQEGATEPLSEEDLNKWLAAQTATGGGNGDQGALAEMSRNQFLPTTVPVDVPGPDAGERERMRQLGQLGMLEGAPIEAETFERAPSGFSVTPQRMPAELIASPRLLSDDDLRQLAASKTFPKALAGGYRTGSSDPVSPGPIQKYQDDFLAMDDPFKREQYLRNLRDTALSRHADEDLWEDIVHYEPFDAGYPVGSIASGLGVGAAGAGLAVAAGPSVLAAIAKGVGPFAAYLAEVGVPLAKLAGSGYIVKALYNAIVSDPGMTEEEARRRIQEEVQKQLDDKTMSDALRDPYPVSE